MELMNNSLVLKWREYYDQQIMIANYEFARNLVEDARKLKNIEIERSFIKESLTLNVTRSF